MSRTALRIAALFALFVLLLVPLAAWAHETLTAGEYTIEYGWLNEPPIAGQPNAIVVNVSPAEAEGHSPVEGGIALLSPADGAEIQGDSVEVTVEFTGLGEHAADEGVHWHLYLDDVSLSMLPLSQTTVTVTGLVNGAHTFRASLSGSDHDDVGEPATAAVVVSGASDHGHPALSGAEPLTSGEESHSHAAFADVDISSLKVEIVYGEQSKTLSLQPLGEDTPGQFVAPLTPTRPGEYTLRFSGQIGDAEVNAEATPEEVESADVVLFPPLETAQSSDEFGLTGWLALGGLIAGLLGLALGIVAVTRKS
jgi:hypothetical protein